jgi:hypothetical protein
MYKKRYIFYLLQSKYFFNYKTEEITNIIISQGFDKNSDGLIINLDVFIKEYINYFREAKLEELFKID